MFLYFHITPQSRTPQQPSGPYNSYSLHPGVPGALALTLLAKPGGFADRSLYNYLMDNLPNYARETQGQVVLGTLHMIQRSSGLCELDFVAWAGGFVFRVWWSGVGGGL